ncbi:hypothetical protein BH23BAC1_BH23BAC1_45890 [soil metagenome]
MKKYFFLQIGLALGLVSGIMFSSCQTDEFSETAVLKEEPELTEDAEASDPTLRINNQVIFPVTAKLLGKSNEDWAIHLAKASVALDCENVSEAQLLKLTDKVVAPYGIVEDASASYTITKDQFVFLSPAFIFNYYGCPAEYEWEPAEGQSIEDFLKEFAKETMDGIKTLDVFFDGIQIVEVNEYRLNTDLFYFTGNPVLTDCYEPCITGVPQPGLVDGYFLMFKKMKKGKHTILIKGEVPSFDFTFQINIVLNVI